MSILKSYKKWEREVYKRKAWNIGFVDYDETTIFKPFKIAWLDVGDYAEKGWFADPFILSRDGNKVEVLVEEMMLDKEPETIFQVGRNRTVTRRRGRISKLEIERDGNGNYILKKVVPILETKYHFSFPAIYRENGKIYIHPECMESGKSTLYCYDTKTESVVPVGTLCDAPLCDSLLFDGFGEPMLFATRADKDDTEQYEKVLDVYRSTTGTLFGPYENVPFAEIEFPDISPRGAGYFLKIGGKCIRVAQDCNGKYGAGTVFYEMKFENGKFTFKELARHFPNSTIWHCGLHTFNTFGDLAVVDGYGYLYPIKRALYRLKDFFRRMRLKRKFPHAVF